MNIGRIIKPQFAVIGKEGSTQEGDGFIRRLWEDANGHFDEVAHLAKKNPDGSLAGVWGAMSDLSRNFQPWQNAFTEGLYLAGVECDPAAQPPEGWSRWDVPGYEYLRVKNDAPDIFAQMLTYLGDNGFTLAGAVQDFTDPATGSGYMLFPVRRLNG